MSETVARTGSGNLPDAAAQPRAPRVLTAVNVVIAVATAVGFGLRLYYQFTRPGFLLGVNEYDDGPYFGSAVLLIHGVVPYRDFVFVQPPGITLLMAPAGLLSTVIGTAWGLAVGRILTLLAGTAAIFLAGRLVRHRGLLTVLLTCGLLAVYPDSVAATHTVLVEPWLVLFCLLGALAVFEGDRVTESRKRLAWAGVAFGFAGAVEAWAIIPVVVVAALYLPRVRRVMTFAAGVAAGFLIPVVPFAALGPRQFYQSLITAQIGARADASRVNLYVRLENMLGLPQVHGWGHRAILAAALLAAVVVISGYLVAPALSRRWPPPLDWFAAITAALVGLMFLWPPQFHYHFSAFLGPFLAITAAFALARVLDWPARRTGEQPGQASTWGKAVAGLTAAVLVVLVAVQVEADRRVPPVVGPIPSGISRIIPRGACVVTDQVSLTLMANRFVSSVPGCPYIVDGLGTDLALSHGLKPRTGAGDVPAVEALWHHAFSRAQYLVISWASKHRIPWTPGLTAYLNDNFTPVFRTKRIVVYAHTGATGQ